MLNIDIPVAFLISLVTGTLFYNTNCLTWVHFGDYTSYDYLYIMYNNILSLSYRDLYYVHVRQYVIGAYTIVFVLCIVRVCICRIGFSARTGKLNFVRTINSSARGCHFISIGTIIEYCVNRKHYTVYTIHIYGITTRRYTAVPIIINTINSVVIIQLLQ